MLCNMKEMENYWSFSNKCELKWSDSAKTFPPKLLKLFLGVKLDNFIKKIFLSVFDYS